VLDFPAAARAAASWGSLVLGVALLGWLAIAAARAARADADHDTCTAATAARRDDDAVHSAPAAADRRLSRPAD